MSVKDVYVTSEVGLQLGYNPTYILRVAKELHSKGILSDDEIREAGKRNYLLSKSAVKKIEDYLSQNKK